MARGCARIDSRLDTAKIGSDGRVEVHRARLLAVFGGRNVSTRPGPFPISPGGPYNLRRARGSGTSTASEGFGPGLSLSCPGASLPYLCEIDGASQKALHLP